MGKNIVKEKERERSKFLCKFIIDKAELQ